jgi:hypothetical protein
MSAYEALAGSAIAPLANFAVTLSQRMSLILSEMLTTLKYAAIALALCWAPLLVVGGLGISDNPVGLGILAVVVSPIVLVVAAIVLAFQLVMWLRTAETR